MQGADLAVGQGYEAVDLRQIINQAGGLGAIASELHITEEQAGIGLDALLPAVLAGFGRSVQGNGGPGALASVVTSAGGAALIDNVLGPGATDVDAGHVILGHVFGSADASQAVAAHAAARTGLDAHALAKLLPVAAMLAAGYMARSSAGTSEGLGSLISSLLGASRATDAGASGVFGALLGSVLGGSGSRSADHAASNPLGDILGMVGKLSTF
jgi:hypothetical protein